MTEEEKKAREQLAEDNGFFARFMGGILEDDMLYDMGSDRLQNGRFWSKYSLHYHEDWNWLMPVVEKLETMRYSINNAGKAWYDDETDKLDRTRTQYVCMISDYSYRVVVNSAGMCDDALDKFKATYVAVLYLLKKLK